MFRSTLLYLSEQKQINAFVRRNPVARKGARRFVAGETLDEAADAVRALNAKRITASLDLLGESVTNADEARGAAGQIVGIFDRIAADRLDCNVSVKLTQLGFDLGADLVRENLRRILDRAKQLGIFLRVDMEGSAHTQRTLDLFEQELFPQYGRDGVGIVVQSYLFRTAADVDRLIAMGARVRLCKGAYKEPASIAFPAKADVDRSFIELAEKLIAQGPYPGIATHDERIIAHVKRFVQSKAIPLDRFEFQMLNGVRRDLQETLVQEGYRLRVYVPFGTQWYPYFMRRLAERPANIVFIVGNVLKEVGR
jgi:proline dehydrogenase